MEMVMGFSLVHFLLPVGAFAVGGLIVLGIIVITDNIKGRKAEREDRINWHCPRCGRYLTGVNRCGCRETQAPQ